MEVTIEQVLQQGVAAHKEGKLQEAERLYRAVLVSQPAHPDANQNLGVLAASVNKVDVALPLFKVALEENPKIEQFWLSYIDALIKEKKFETAKLVLAKGNRAGLTKEKMDVLAKKLMTTAIVKEANLTQRNDEIKFLETREKRSNNNEKKALKQKNKNINPPQAELNSL